MAVILGDLGPFDSPSRPPVCLRDFRDTVNLIGLPIQGIDRLIQSSWELYLDPSATTSYTPWTTWQRFLNGRTIFLSQSQMFPYSYHNFQNSALCTNVVYHECTHAYLFEFEDDIGVLKNNCESYYGSGSLAAGKSDDPWLIAHESGAGYVGDLVRAFVSMFCSNSALRNGVNWSSPGTPEISTQSKKGVVLAYIADFGRTLRRSTFGRVGTDETAIVKPIYPDLRRFLSAKMIPRLEETGRWYADMFSSEINELYPSSADQ